MLGGIGGLTLVGCSSGVVRTPPLRLRRARAQRRPAERGHDHDHHPLGKLGFVEQNPTTPTSDGILSDGVTYQMVMITESAALGGYDASLVVGISV